MKNLDFNNIEYLKQCEFDGFKSINELINDSSSIPKEKGVYLILNPDKKSDFLATGTGGHFKEKDPNVSIEELKQNWVDNTIVLYIGKAGNLYNRIKLYLSFGQGKKKAHWGGRLIWQLKNSRDLIVCWKTLQEDDNPRTVESDLIKQFRSNYSKRPFANLRG
ncbi:MAG: GIY-YIG nuclease family protein [Tannerellaceae bacterium]|jgi:hypothetical protein|nr:GIY-YIG nuclease family protein [Tannerellaceae bacterium]